ncbi:MAG: hypothetical protein ACI3XW_08585 [Butyricicoccus sp.]
MAITIEEFNQLSELLEEQQRLNRRYKELQAQNTVAAPAVHMCGGKGYRSCDRVGDLVAARDEVRQQFKDNAGIMKGIIRRVENRRIQQIMQYRFLKGMTWRRVAAASGYQSEDSPRQVLSRYKNTLKSAGCGV